MLKLLSAIASGFPLEDRTVKGAFSSYSAILDWPNRRFPFPFQLGHLFTRLGHCLNVASKVELTFGILPSAQATA